MLFPMHSVGLFFCALSLLPQTLLALPKGTSVPTYAYSEVEKFWNDVLNITAPPPPSGIEVLDGYSQACETLEVVFGNLGIQQNEQRYEARRTANWAQTAWLHPTCIFMPQTPEEVSTALKILTFFNSPFAVRSGGHQVAPGFSNIDNGVLLDMSGFNEITYIKGQNTAVIGTGALWGPVYEKLEQYGVTAIGGRVGGVGVGGLLLGSGLSYLSNKYGMACDNVVNFEVVLANGRIIDADNETNTDLFWALKGGTNNFGVVTRFTLNVYPLGNIYGGIIGYSNADASAVLSALAEYQDNGELDENANLMIQVVLTNDTLGTLVNVFYAKPVDNPEVFAPFYKIPAVFNTAGVKSYSDFISGATDTDIPRWDLRTTSFLASADMYQNTLRFASEAKSSLNHTTAGTLLLAYQPISESLVDQGQLRGGNALGLKRAKQTWFALNTGWWNPSDDTSSYELPTNIMNQVEDDSKANDLYIDYVFMNDASRDQEVIAHYGEANVAELKKIAAKYDPSQVFQRLESGGFKLP